ncbi:DUF881 domain-containing protein [Clostridium sardiniense]|uniref:DUF881 domain-containing protein n=1 Tax=Clostridium sardiniense TaxID=29369 RepID=A0ABS7KW83_CLOSR|nr:DUF881 domain-containing protein [Clostridium sardiniense]MBM7835872.1 uncharacterized protein YlxW (UPF0749 family) [Clostridium sardiniense]MBY0754863.1 DUF881 domain-containing protein [Clostridium sardiniense]MDQ0461688.1 uncharacterized protein YlxW (UPF0749 family) [Clostridium sardiniense]
MKKSTSQISIAIVCALLGFLLAYQFKLLNKNNESNIESYNKSDVIAELDSLKKEKEGLQNKNNSLNEELKKLEEAASKEGNVGKEIKNQLDSARMHLGLVDVKGPGVTIKITPKTSIFGSSNDDIGRGITEEELIHIINLLWYSKAEAISINGYRVTPQTGIKNSSNYIWIGTAGKVSPKEPIIIKAIGDKARLNVGLNFPGSLDFGALQNYNCEVEQSDNLVIDKTTQTIKSDYLKPVEKKEEK